MVCSPYLALRVMGATSYLAIVDSPIGASSVHCPLVLSAGSALCVHTIPYQYPPYLVPPHPRRVILPSFFLFDSAFLDSRLLVPCECRSRALAFVALRVRPPECLDVHFFAASLVHSMIASHSREFCCYCSAAPSDLTPRAVPDALRVTGGRVVQRSRFRSWDRDSTASLPRW